MAGCFSPIACGKNGKPLEDDGDDDPANTRERKARLDLVRGSSRGNITDKFTFGRTLGTGAFALVKMASEREMGMQVAVKIINMDPQAVAAAGGKGDTSKGSMRSSKSGRKSNGEYNAIPSKPLITYEEVLNEIEVLKVLDHPNVLHFVEHFLSPGQDKIYIVTEILDGGELLDAVIERGSFTEADARSVFRGVLLGLQFLHDNGVIHRDVKLENLLLADKRDLTSVHLVDFGLARAEWRPFDSVLEQTGNVVVGTPSYAAPEVVTSKQYGPESDCWSAGVVLFVLLSGCHPFDQERDREFLFRRIAIADYSCDREEMDGVGKQAKKLIERLMCLNPSRRISAEKALQHAWFTEHPSETQLNARSKLRDYLETESEIRTFRPGEFLLEAGIATDQVYLIRSGVCERLKLASDAAAPKARAPSEASSTNGVVGPPTPRPSWGGPTSRYECSGTISSGEFVGEMEVDAGMAKELPTEPTSVRAVTQVKVSVVPRGHLEWVCNRDAEIKEEFQEVQRRSTARERGEVFDPQQGGGWEAPLVSFWKGLLLGTTRNVETFNRNIQGLVTIASCGMGGRPRATHNATP